MRQDPAKGLIDPTKLPNLFVIGAPKAGTTSLIMYMASHPNVFVGKVKEPNHWAKELPKKGEEARTWSGYTRLYDRAAAHHRIRVDGSTSYCWSQSAVPDILQHLPDSKFIFMIRNPISLAPSLHSEEVLSGHEDVTDFNVAWQLQSDREKGGCIPQTCTTWQKVSYRFLSSLGTHLQRLIRIIPPNQLHLILFDDFARDPHFEYLRVLEFLNLARIEPAEYRVYNQARHYRLPAVSRLILQPPGVVQDVALLARRLLHHVGVRGLRSGLVRTLAVPGKPSAPNEETLEAMRDYFEPEIVLLESLLSRPLLHWRARRNGSFGQSRGISTRNPPIVRPLKLAFFLGEFPKISETFIIDQVTEMIDRGHEVTLYGEPVSTTTVVHPAVKRYENRWKVDLRKPIPVDRVARARGALRLVLKYGWQNSGLIARSLHANKYGRCSASFKLLYAAIPFVNGPARYDVISCHFADYGMLAIALREMGALEGKIVTTFHGYDLSSYLAKAGRAAYQPLLKGGDFFLPVSETWRRRLASLGCAEAKMAVHHMGVDCARFALRDRLLGQSDEVKLLSNARLVEKKGLRYSIMAFAQVARIHPNISYEIIGDGPLKEELSTLINSLGMGAKIVLRGWKSSEEVVRALDSAHIFVAPSLTASDGDQEGIPVTIMEAMATGLPVVSSWHSGIPELVKHEVSGLLAPERDVATLASHLLTLIERPELRREMGHAGHKLVRDNFEIGALNTRLEELFRDIVNAGR